MKISINNREIEIFSGARVKDALMKYSVEDYHHVMKGKKMVVDKMGNRSSLDGEISEGDCFMVKSRKKYKSHEK